MKDKWWFSVLPALCFIIAYFFIFLAETKPKIVITTQILIYRNGKQDKHELCRHLLT